MGIDNLKGKTWIQNNTFKVFIGAGGGNPFSGKEYNIKSVAMPDFTRSAVEEYNNGTWNIAFGRQEVYQIAITFWDNEQDDLYSKAFKFWDGCHLKYWDDKKFNIYVAPAARSNRDSIKGGGVWFKEAILDSLSGLQWDNSSQNQLVEFTANFKAYEVTPT